MNYHNKCGCVEQFHGLDCPACKGTGVTPPITYAEFLEMEDRVRRLHDLERAFEKFPFTAGQRKLMDKHRGSKALDIILALKGK